MCDTKLSENTWAEQLREMKGIGYPQFENQSCFTGTFTVTGPKSDNTPSMLQWLALSIVEEEREQVQLELYHSTIGNHDSNMLCLKSHLKLISQKRLRRRMQSKACWAFRACRNQKPVDCLSYKSWKSFCCVTTFVVKSGAWLITKIFWNESICQLL